MKPKKTDVMFINATMLDGSADMKPRHGCAVVVRDGKIARVSAATDAESLAEGARIVNLDGAYLMPGLINMHVHFIGDGRPRSASKGGATIDKAMSNPIGRAVVHAMVKKSAVTQLNSGVTTVRGAGDPGSSDIWCRKQIDAGKFAGPRIVAPGTGVTVPHGHAAGLFAEVCDTPEAAVAAVKALAAQGADVIKLFVTGGVLDAERVGEPGVLRMPPETTAAACKASHDLGLPVMAHVESTEGVLSALTCGVDTIEHGAPMTPEIEKLYLKGSGAQLPGRTPSVTCTISPALPLSKLPAEQTHSTEVQKINGDLVCAGVVESAKRAIELGIPVGLGTDSSCPFVTQYDMWREVAYFAKHVGVTPAFALHTATQVNAGLIGLGDTTGTIAEGFDADILVTAKNPLDDLSALASPKLVMARGVLIENPQVKHYPELDAVLDGIMADNTPLPTYAEKLAEADAVASRAE